MNSSHPEHLAPHSFLVRVYESDHSFDVGVYLLEAVAQFVNNAEPCLYLRKAIFNRGQSSRDVVIGTAHRFTDIWDTLTLQYRGLMRVDGCIRPRVHPCPLPD